MADKSVAFPAIGGAGSVVPIRARDTGVGVYALSVSGLTPPFTPASIATLDSWVIADLISGNDGDTVAAWADQSGAGNNMTTAAGHLPILKKAIINGHAVVRGDGTKAISGPFTLSATRSLCFVGNWRSGAAFPDRLADLNPNYLAGAGGLNGCYYGDATDVGFYQENRGPITGVVTSTTTPMVISIVWQAGSVYVLRVNGTQILTGTFSNSIATNNGYTLLASAIDATEGSPGDVAESASYSSDIGTTNLHTLEQYFGTKYAITVA